MFLVFPQCTHKTKVHEEFGATVSDTVGGTLCSLLSNVGLLLEIDVSKWMVVKG
jgi:hypothetical protein